MLESQVHLLVWIFSMRIMMVVASGVSYFLNGFFAKSKYQGSNITAE